MTAALALLLVSALLAAPAVARLRGAAAVVLPLPLVAVAAMLARHAPAVLQGRVPRELLARIGSLDVELALRLDGLGLVFALLVASIGALVLIHAAGYFRDDPGRLGRFAAYAYLFAAAMTGLVLADDLVLLFVGWELTSVCSFLLIGLDHHKADARTAARRALVVTGLGGVALLVGLLLLASAAETTAIGALLERGDAVRESGRYLPILGLVLLAAFTKSAQVPFHFWLPGAMAAPGPVSAFLHSATLVKAGVFLLARLHPVLGFRPEWHVILGHAGAATLLVGSVLAFAQDDLKRMLAYTTVAGLGTLVLLLGIGTEPALRAAILFAAVHALYKASLFLVVGYLDQRTGTRDVKRLAGLWRAAPVAFVAAALAALSMSGLPPLLGAISKELVYEAKLGAPEAPRLLAGVGTLGNALGVSCALLVGAAPFLRRGSPPALRPVPAVRLLSGPLVLSALGLLLGLAHGTLAAPWIDAAVDVAQGEPTTADFARDASPGTVAWLGKATLVAGVLGVALRRRLTSAGAGLARLADFGPGAAHERVLRALASAGEVVARISAEHVVRRSLVSALALLAGAGLALAVSGPGELSLPSLDAQPHHVPLLLLVAAGAVAAARARSHAGAVSALGVAGFGAGMLFLVLGGPDLALTQVAVESLAVLLLLSVLSGVPLGPERRPRAARLLDGLLSLAVGATFTALVWAAAPDGSSRPLARELAAASLPEGYGRNVVNVLLVDVRALDTLGEIVVLALAALGVGAVLTGARASSSAAPRLDPAHTLGRSPILRAAARSVVPLVALLSLVFLVRGHHEPGGGFVGGLAAASAAVLHAFAFGLDATRARLFPDRLIAAGLALALGAGALGIPLGDGFLAGVWLPVQVPALGKLGTPLLFDAGVFLVVFGVSTRMMFDLLEAEGSR